MQIDFVSTTAGARDAVLRQLGPRLPLHAGAEVPAAAPAPGHLLWIHGDPPELDVERLAARVAAGQKLLLSGAAAMLIARIGAEPVRPEIRRGAWPSDVGPRALRGVMALPGQPLFHRAPGGPYLRLAEPDRPFAEAVWDRGNWPARARVLGVEKLPIGCDATRAILVEARLGRGRVLALGAHFPLEFGDRDFAEHRARFAGDLIDHLVDDLAAERGPAWPSPWSRRSVRFTPVADRDAPAAQRPAAAPIDDATARALDLSTDASFVLTTAAGHAAYGRARSFLGEVWARSFRAFRDIALRIASGDDALAPFGDGAVDARVHPDELRWTWRRGDAVATLRLARTAEGDGFCIVLANPGGAPLRCELSGASDLRPFWPYPAGTSAVIEASSSWQDEALSIGDPLFDSGATLVSDLRPVRASIVDASAPVRDGDGGAMVSFVREYLVEPGTELVVTLRARASAPAIRATTSLVIRVGDPAIDASLALVKARLLDCFQPFDAHSAGLVAGHDRSRKGWFTGRPGYAWFFGRDAFTCDAALLPFGAREVVRADLELAARFQDPLGKIHHELTPLGVVHHDAADATPMFVDLLGRWFAWTGDLAFVKSLWPALRRAVQFLERCDRDGDALPENVGVGHGWMEGGPLAEHVVAEVYLAAYACRAWAAAVVLARAVGDDEFAKRCASFASRARESLRTRFFRGEDGGFAHALRSDGSRDDRDAVTTVVPWTLALGEHGRESDALRRFATARAQADWGSRMLPDDDPAFDPRSYQAGSVWPLFTGWTTLADFLHGRPDSAWLRLLPLVRSVEHFAPGSVQEVFVGDVYEPRGIASLQAWSHAAVLAGFAQGLLGARETPDDARVILEPTLPGAVDQLEFEGLRIGDAVIAGSVHRDADGCGLELVVTLDGEPRELELAPFFPSPVVIRGVTQDGAPLAMREEPLGDGVLARTRVALRTGTTRVRFDAIPDLVVAIEMPPLEPGARSNGPRFLGRRCLDVDTVALDFELTAPTAIGIRTPGRRVVNVTGGELVDGGRTLSIAPPPGTGHRPCTVTVRFAPCERT